MMPEVLVEVRNLLRTAMGARCKKYYVGDRFIPSKSTLPCLIVSPVSTGLDRQSAANDKYRFSVSILVITDLTKSFNEAGLTDDILASTITLGKIMEEADTDGAPKTNTVLGALMKQTALTGTNYTYNLQPKIDYAPIPPVDDFYYVAAQLNLDFLSQYVTRK